MPMLAALSAAHLAAILFPPTLRRAYCGDYRMPDGAGWRSEESTGAASAAGEDGGCQRSTAARFMKP
jgi:hypothetical protein